MLNLDINIIFEIINIVILFFLLKKFLFGPVTAIMEKRDTLIRATFEEAENTQKKANELKAEYENQLNNAREEATSIVKEAKLRGEKEYDAIVANANKDAEKIISNAVKSAQAEKEKVMRTAGNDIVALALTAAGKVIEKNANNLSDEKLIEDFLAEAGDVK